MCGSVKELGDGDFRASTGCLGLRGRQAVEDKLLYSYTYFVLSTVLISQLSALSPLIFVTL